MPSLCQGVSQRLSARPGNAKALQGVQGLSEEEAVMEAFEENAHDLMRVGGK